MELGELYDRFERCLKMFERLMTGTTSYLRTEEAKKSLSTIEDALGTVANELTLQSIQKRERIKQFEKEELPIHKSIDGMMRRGPYGKKNK